MILHNFYGPSETHVVTSFDIQGGAPLDMIHVPIGKPVFNTRIYIVNERMKLQPKGLPGELYIATDNLFAGYLRQEGLTSSCCIASPFVEGEVLYKTGDFGRWMYDGNIEYLGRKDHQVKIRGFRIELKEIEYYISRYAGVENALVVCQQGHAGEKMLVAYLVAQQSPDLNQLYNYLCEKLPEYMVPLHFIVLDAFPLNQNGKVDRKLLPAPQDPVFNLQYQAPESETEIRLHAIWAEILGAGQIGVNDNFFKIGGHSLTATRMASKILKELNIDINLRKIYKHATIKELAAEIDAQQWVNKTYSNESLKGNTVVI